MTTQTTIEAAARKTFCVERLGYNPKDIGADRNGRVFLASWYLGTITRESWENGATISFENLSEHGEMFMDLR